MDSLAKNFLKFQAKTTPHPLSLSIKKAKGCILQLLMEKNI